MIRRPLREFLPAVQVPVEMDLHGTLEAHTLACQQAGAVLADREAQVLRVAEVDRNTLDFLLIRTATDATTRVLRPACAQLRDLQRKVAALERRDVRATKKLAERDQRVAALEAELARFRAS